MIQLKNVNFRYAGGADAGGLYDINLDIPDGQVFLLCGESGCGKTTLTRLINGLIPNYYDGELTGDILLDGKNVSTLPLYETAKQVGSVFQNPRTQFFTVDSTSELAFASENQGLPENEIIKRVLNTANQFDLESLLGRNIFHMSGGEKQKIACASISVSNPKVIVLDEPSSNLDIAATDDLRRSIKIWKKQGKTIVIAEHRLHYLHNLIDKVIYLKDGKINKTFTKSDINSLSTDKLFAMGLRPFDLSKFGVAENPKKFKDSVILSDFIFSYTKKQEILSIPRLSFPVGSTVAVIGHNGAGKSTFAHLLCGLKKLFKGIVTIGEKRYTRKQLITHSYMVMQDVNCQLFTESVLDEVMISLKSRNKKTACNILENLNLIQFKDRHPMTLSGGQKQRLAIACALASNRDILVFDEPTSGLDFKHMKDVAIELSALRDINKTTFVITHDYELIASCCTHVFHLEQGRNIDNYTLNAIGIQKLKDFFL